MTNDERELEIQHLKWELAQAQARRRQLLEEIVHLAAQLPEMRRKFGNPFYYSHPEEPDEGIANYNPNHGDGGSATWRAVRRIERELERIQARLCQLEGDESEFV